jgi:hypothetical protein
VVEVRGSGACPHRVSKPLLRHGHVYYGGAAWTGKHEQWLLSIRFDQAGTQAAYEADQEAVDFAVARRGALDAVIAAMAADPESRGVGLAQRRLCEARPTQTNEAPSGQPTRRRLALPT